MARTNTANQVSTEQDTRLNILNTLLTTPHRKLDEIYPVHQDMVKQDPLFYVRLAAWYVDNGEIRDHKEMFIINLCLSDFDGHREVGLALLRDLPPYQVARVVDFIHGKKIKRTITQPAAVRPGRRASVPAPTTLEAVQNFGLFKNIPRSVKTEIARYLKERENDNDWFDSSALTARKHLKRLYALLHISPSERAQAILFDDNPPADSKLAAFKLLAAAKTPAEQAKIIIENKVPFRVASTVVDVMSPTIMLALIEVMSSQELINSMGMLKKRGVLENPDLKKIVLDKLEVAKKSKRVSALKSTEAAKVVGDLGEEINAKLAEVADTQVKSKGRIKKTTALFIDKSGSMSSAIAIGKQVAALVSAIIDADFYVYSFDNMAYPITSKGTDLASWEKAMTGITAGGGTACGVPFHYMMRAKQLVEQVIIITDEGDNNSPSFTSGYNDYVRTFNIRPNVILIKTVGATGYVESQCRGAKIDIESYQFNGDYYALPGLIPYLTRPGRLDLLMEIMTYELPQRKSA